MNFEVILKNNDHTIFSTDFLKYIEVLLKTELLFLLSQYEI